MAAFGGLAGMHIRALRCRAGLGIHVELIRLNLLRTQVAELVEGANDGSARGLAIRGLPSGLAWNGCAILPGRKQSRCTAATAELVLGSLGDGTRDNSALGIARALPEEQPLLRGWAGMLGLIFLLHFGIFQIVSCFWQSCGVAAEPIMSAPLRSASLSEFWGKRWNLGFRQLAYDLVFGPLHKSLGVGAAGFLVFVASGLIHDLVISVPARGGYGLPTAYFVLQGVGVSMERSRIGRRLGLRDGISGRLFLVLIVAAPVFWLFHPPFVLRVIIPFMKAIRAL